MPAWIYPAGVFVGWLASFLLCGAIAITGLVMISSTSRSSSRAPKTDEAQRVDVQFPKFGLKLGVTASAGVLMALLGTGGVLYITTQYWKVWLAVVLLLAGGGVAQHERRAHRRKRKDSRDRRGRKTQRYT
jgi:cytochrome c biogenesis protein CcdA